MGRYHQQGRFPGHAEFRMGGRTQPVSAPGGSFHALVEGEEGHRSGAIPTTVEDRAPPGHASRGDLGEPHLVRLGTQDFQHAELDAFAVRGDLQQQGRPPVAEPHSVAVSLRLKGGRIASGASRYGGGNRHKRPVMEVRPGGGVQAHAARLGVECDRSAVALEHKGRLSERCGEQKRDHPLSRRPCLGRCCGGWPIDSGPLTPTPLPASGARGPEVLLAEGGA